MGGWVCHPDGMSSCWDFRDGARICALRVAECSKKWKVGRTGVEAWSGGGGDTGWESTSTVLLLRVL